MIRKSPSRTRGLSSPRSFDSQLALQGIPGKGRLFVPERFPGCFEIDPVLQLFEQSEIFYRNYCSDVFAMPLQYNALASEGDIVYDIGEANSGFGGGETSHVR